MNVLRNRLEDPFEVFDDEGNVVPFYETKKYLLLVYAEDEEGNEIRTFDIVMGRQNVVKLIVSVYPEEMEEAINPFESMVISDSIKLEDGISFYSFIRLCLEQNMLTDEQWADAVLDSEEEPFTLDVWNDYVIELFPDVLTNYEGEDWSDKLNQFYKEDITKQQ